MGWDTLDWRAVDPAALEGADALADLVPMARSAVEEAVSALVLGPVTVAALEITEPPAGGLPDGLTGAASFELLGTPRRNAWVALDPSAGTLLNGTDLARDTLAGALVEAFDSLMTALLGDGLAIQPADGSEPAGDGTVILFRLVLRDALGAEAALVAALDAGLPLELATHVTALQALGSGRPVASSRPATTPVAPAPAPVAPAPAPVAPARAQVQAPAGAPEAPAAQVRPFVLDQLSAAPAAAPTPNIELLLGVNLAVTVELGRANLAIRDVLNLTAGSIVELDKLAGEKVDVLVNGYPIAQGEVVVVDENFGVRITDVVSRQHRILSANGAA